MNRATALVLGVLTVAPWGYMVYFFSHFMRAFSSVGSTGTPPDRVFEDFQALMRIHMFVMALVLALMVFYVVHLFRTDRVAADKKTLWAVVLFLGNLIAMPVYWYLYVWPRRREGAA